MGVTLCCCDCRTTTYTFTLCGAPVRSTPVTFTKGAETVGGTTNTLGQVTVTFPDDGTWAFAVGVTAGTEPDYTGLTGAVSVTCGLRNAQLIALGCNFPATLTYAGTVSQAQSAFYFINVPLASPEATPYTLTWGTRPAEIPKDLLLLFFSAPGGVADPYYISMPDEAWFSAAIPSTIFGGPTDVYFYGFRSNGCTLNVMVVDAPYTTGTPPADTKGAGNNVRSYTLHTCVPFAMGSSTRAPFQVTGTHGGDDLTDLHAGQYTNARIGLTYAIQMIITDPTGHGPSTFPRGQDYSAHLHFTTGEGGGTYTPPSASWSSGDTSVFTITPIAGTGNATLHPVGVGTATLTMTATDPNCTNPTITRSVTVT